MTNTLSGSMIVRVVGLSESPLDAAAEFLSRELAKIRHDLLAAPVENLVVVFEPVGHEHRAWRLAAIQELARELAPTRVNAVVGDEKHLDEATSYLNDATGVTGQVLAVGPS